MVAMFQKLQCGVSMTDYLVKLDVQLYNHGHTKKERKRNKVVITAQSCWLPSQYLNQRRLNVNCIIENENHLTNDDNLKIVIKKDI